WDALARADAIAAYRAQWALIRAGDKAVAFLRDRLEPVAQGDVDSIRRLLAELDAVKYAVREAAFTRLKRYGAEIEPEQLRALEGDPPREARKRVTALVGALKGAVPRPEVLQALRALRILEQGGFGEARDVLQAVANGAPEAPLTRAAAAALRRLSG